MPTCETCESYTKLYAWCHHQRQAMQPDATCPRHRPRGPSDFRRGIECACRHIDALAAGIEAQAERSQQAEAVLDWCRKVAATLRQMEG